MLKYILTVLVTLNNGEKKLLDVVRDDPDRHLRKFISKMTDTWMKIAVNVDNPDIKGEIKEWELLSIEDTEPVLLPNGQKIAIVGMSPSFANAQYDSNQDQQQEEEGSENVG